MVEPDPDRLLIIEFRAEIWDVTEERGKRDEERGKRDRAGEAGQVRKRGKRDKAGEAGQVRYC